MKTKPKSNARAILAVLFIALTIALCYILDLEKVIAGIFGEGPYTVYLAGASVLLVSAGIFWWGFVPWKSRNGTGNGAAMLITLGLIYSVIVASRQVVQAQEIVTAPSMVVTNNVQMIRLDIAQQDPFLRDALRELQKGGAPTVELYVPSCDVKIILALVFIVGVGWVLVKVVKACKGIEKKKKKQVEDEDEDHSTNHQQSVTSDMASRSYPEGTTFYRACFSAGYEVPTLEDSNDSSMQAPFTFTCKLTETGTTQLVPRIPAALVDYDAYQLEHGLSTNTGATSFSVNNVPTNSLSIISFDSNTGIASINLPNTTNVLSVIQYSTNLVEWSDVVKISAPVGMMMEFQNAYSAPASQGYWKVIRRP